LLVRSYYLLNSCSSITFSALSTSLVFNGQLKTTITRGTYSTGIPITTPTGVAFQTNVQMTVTCSSYPFGYLPDNAFVIQYGEFSGNLIIGADRTLTSKAYSCTLSKDEIANVALYTS